MKSRRAVFIVNSGNHWFPFLIDALEKNQLQVFLFSSFQEAKAHLNIVPDVIVFDDEKEADEARGIISTSKLTAKPKLLEVTDDFDNISKGDDKRLGKLVNKIQQLMLEDVSLLKLFRTKVFALYNF